MTPPHSPRAAPLRESARHRLPRPVTNSARVRPAPPAAGKPEPLLLGSGKLVRGSLRRVLVIAIGALVIAAALASVSGAAKIGAHLTSGRPAWLILAAGFELMATLGFAATFQLIFGEWLPKHTSLRLGMTVCAATILVPAGGLLAIGAGARALSRRGMPPAKTRARAIAFLLITNAPNAIVLGVLGVALGAGLLDGPHTPAVTILPGVIALSAIGLPLLLPMVSHRRLAQARHTTVQGAVSTAAAQLELGVIEAVALLRGRSWKLLGAVAYYAFDNAVLWATFKAFGHAEPPIATLVIAYLIGSAAGSLPVPAGLGVVEGGMIGLLVFFGAPVICTGIAVLAYRAVSTGMPLALGGVAFLTLRRGAGGARHRKLATMT